MPEKIFEIYRDIFNRAQAGVSEFSWNDAFQILFVILIVFYIYMKFIRNTQAEKLVRGILIFIVATWVFSGVLFALDLQILGRIARYLLTGLLLSMVIVFQP